MNQLGYQRIYKSNLPNEADWVTSNSVALVVELPYVKRPLLWPYPAPTSHDLAATTLPEEEVSDDALLQQVLAQFSVELHSPMPEEAVARIEEETPEVPAKYDLATYEYEYVEESDKDSV
ncbi:MAG: hypothetical protein FJ014_15450 [Chloroflexi bacterium]|nr:hypothetical protein [Chloroflexota bacterium]